MELVLEKTVEDSRGKIVIYRFGPTQINVIQTNKGFSRGGHWHRTETHHQVLAGRLEFKTVDPSSPETEEAAVFGPNSTVSIPAGVAHIMTALEDSVFIEAFEGEYESTNYPAYRDVVEEKMRGKA